MTASDRAHLDHRGEAGDPRVARVEAEELLGDREVAGARDREELGQPLDDAEDDCLEVVHLLFLVVLVQGCRTPYGAERDRNMTAPRTSYGEASRLSHAPASIALRPCSSATWVAPGSRSPGWARHPDLGPRHRRARGPRPAGRVHRGRRDARRHRRRVRRGRLRGADRLADRRRRAARRPRDRHQGRHQPGPRRPGDQRVARLPDPHPRRLAAPARRRPRRPVAGAHLGRRHPARGDADAPSTTRSSTGRAAYVGVSNYTGWQSAQAATWQRAVPGRAVAGLDPGGVLPGEPQGRGRGAAGRGGARARACCPGRRSAAACSPGKYRHGTPADSRAASPHFSSFVGSYLGERHARIVEAVARAAEGLDWSPLEVALTWVRDRPGVVAPIVGARTAAQLRGSLPVEELRAPARRSSPPSTTSRAAPTRSSRGRTFPGRNRDGVTKSRACLAPRCSRPRSAER